MRLETLMKAKRSRRIGETRQGDDLWDEPEGLPGALSNAFSK
jgi:hypothetical protein